jgi:hypothetical protein
VRICVGKKPNAAVINCNEVCINAKKKAGERRAAAGNNGQRPTIEGEKAFEVETGTAEIFFFEKRRQTANYKKKGNMERCKYTIHTAWTGCDRISFQSPAATLLE